jgi:predicted AAA+ superfamily ATPase
MKLSELYETAESQKAGLEKHDTGLERSCLSTLPTIRKHALIISGIRRCGKSTLLHQLVKKLEKTFFYCNYDDIRLHDFSANDYQLLDRVIADSGAKLLFFDEIQSAEQWELYIRQKLDEGFQVILTGSNASLLSKELGTRLTGRHITKELFPFSYAEYCRFTKQKSGVKSLDAYLEKGGFPEYLKSDNPEILAQLQSDILYRDIAVRYGIRDVSSLRQLFVYLVSNAAQPVSPSKLTAAAGVKSPTTVLEYFSYFESAYLISLLPCFSWSAKAMSVAPKKLYVIDPGIIRTSSLSFTENAGALLENFVFNSLRQHTKDLFYFADKNHECDFIVNPHGKRPLCIQVCRELTSDNQDREIQGMFTALDFFEQKEGIIITRNTEDIILKSKKKITVIPAWKYEFEKTANQTIL